MPSLNINFLNKLQDNYTNYNTFIESGTYEGDTIFSLEPYFNNLFTIEYSKSLYENTKNKYMGNKINFILGDSSIIFNTLLLSIKEKSIFFLDGHWSGGLTGKSDKDCPLIEEITCINNLFVNDAIIIIDDHRLFEKGPNNSNANEDWSLINDNSIINILKNRISKLYYLDSECAKDDRMIIHINKL